MPPRPAGRGKMLYQVRVPVAFDHRNAELFGHLRDRQVRLMQAIGRGSALVSNESIESGRFEVSFELNRDDTEDGRHAAAADAITLVEEALTTIGLTPDDTDHALRLVQSDVVTIPLAASPS